MKPKKNAFFSVKSAFLPKSNYLFRLKAYLYIVKLCVLA